MVENSPKKMEIQALVVVWHVQTVSSWMPFMWKKTHLCFIFRKENANHWVIIILPVIDFKVLWELLLLFCFALYQGAMVQFYHGVQEGFHEDFWGQIPRCV